jgi:hypothetical protein
VLRLGLLAQQALQMLVTLWLCFLVQQALQMLLHQACQMLVVQALQLMRTIVILMILGGESSLLTIRCTPIAERVHIATFAKNGQDGGTPPQTSTRPTLLGGRNIAIS